MLAWIWVLGFVVLLIGVAWGAHMGNLRATAKLFSLAGGSTTGAKPCIWWHVDDSQTNTREWLDWGDRETTEPNEPYLRICLARARSLWSHEFDVRPLIGRQAVVDYLRSSSSNKANKIDIPTGWGEVPPALWMAWSRSAVLASEGGLWLDGSVLPVASGTTLWRRTVGDGKQAIAFGYDPAENIGAGAAAGGNAAGWAASAGHPVWSGLARDIGSLISAGAPSWSSPEARRSLRTLWDRHCTGGSIFVDRAAEVSRDKYGHRLELDTLLGETEWATGSLKDGLWVPMPDGRDSLERTVPYQWFLRLSEEQIRESKFVWAKWATKATKAASPM